MNNNFVFIKIPYCFLEDEKRITPEELYLYFKLTERKLAISDQTFTSVNLLSQEITYLTREDRNKNKINKLLNNLNTKNFISYQLDQVTNSSLLIINFPYLNVDNNFVIIYFDEYYKFNSPEELFIYVYIKKWGKLGARKSYDEWSMLLNKSQTTAKTLLYNLNTNNIINIITGTYYVNEIGQNLQSKNKYFISIDNKESIKHKTKVKKEKPKIQNNEIPDDIPTNFKYNDLNYNIKDIRNNIINGKYLNEEDFIYIQIYGSIDSEVKKIFDKRYNAMKNSTNEWVKNKIKEWNENFTLWNNKINKFALLDKYGIIAKDKDGVYSQFSYDLIDEVKTIIFEGTYQKNYSFDNYETEKGYGVIETSWYDKNTLKSIIDRIYSEGRNIDIKFFENEFNTIREEIF